MSLGSLHWLLHPRIGFRIALGFGVVLAALVGLAITGNLSLNRAGSDFDRFAVLNGQTTRIFEIETRLIDLQRRVLTYAYSGYDGIVTRARTLIDELRAQLKLASLSIEDLEQRQLVQRMSEVFDLYAKNFEFMVQERELRDRWIKEEIQPIAAQITEDLSELRDRASTAGAIELVVAFSAARGHLLLAHQRALEFQDAPDSTLARAAYQQLDALDRQLNALDDQPLDARDPISVQDLKTLAQHYRHAFSGMVQSIRVYQHLIYVVMAGEASELADLADLLKTRTLARQVAIRTHMSDESQRVRTLMFSGSILAILVTGALAWLIGRGITRPLTAVTQTLSAFSAGRMDAEIPYRDRRDEIGALAAAADSFRHAVVSRERAEAANRAKSLFLAHMSHELRTPLNAILGFSQLMEQMPDTPEAHQRYLKIVNRSGSHLLEMINDILDMTKIESGQFRLITAPFDLWQVISDVGSMFQLRAEQQGLKFRIERAAEVPRALRSDAARLRQVLINLLGNAIKFTERGEVALKITVETSDADSARVRFAVEDTGPGIPAESLSAIFDPFIQVGRANQAGTGLGLAICQRFIKLLGGEIQVESTLGQGSRFSFWIPIESAASAEIEAVESQSRPALGLEPGQPRYRLLNVEDNLNNRMLLASVLEPLELPLREAEDGVEGVRLFEQWRPDLIWMDIRMPRLDGREAMRRIRALPGGDSCKIIALTASTFADEKAQILASGFDDFLSKPYRTAEIYRVLERHLGLRFRYAEHPSSSGEDRRTPIVSRSRFAIPDALVSLLKEAVVLGDSERIEDLLRDLDRTHPEAVAILREWVADYQYERILRWLEDDDAS